MGVYYIAVCEALREYIDPGRIADSGRKDGDVVEGPCANVVAWAMLYRWRGRHVRYVADTGAPDCYLYEEAKLGDEGGPPWTDVTGEVVKDMTDEE